MIVKTSSFSYAQYWSKSVSFSSGSGYWSGYWSSSWSRCKSHSEFWSDSGSWSSSWSGYWSMNSRFWKKNI